MKKQKYPALPLITCDPYFNVWSMSNTLNGDFPRHWTGMQHPLTGTVTVDGIEKTFMGMKNHNPYFPQCNKLADSDGMDSIDKMEQIDVCITPLKTMYLFADDKIELKVTFMTPLFAEDIEVMSRPVSFMLYKIRSVDGKKHDISVYVDVSAMLCVHTADETVLMGREDGFVYCSSGSANMLRTRGDNKRICWGRICLAAPGAHLGTTINGFKNISELKKINHDNELYKVSDVYPAIFALHEHKQDDNAEAMVCFAYDDLYSLEYFGKKIKGYWTKSGKTFSEMLHDSVNRFKEFLDRADKFDDSLMKKAEKIGDNYARLIAVSYRQVIGSHKLAYDEEETIFVSKECFSGGFASTVDVSYPSFPMFILLNTDLAEYMLNPIFRMINSGRWPYDFAPHDVGMYPLLNGQLYGLERDGYLLSKQMPVEECGNMIICIAAICKKRGNTACAEKHFELLNKWAEYLAEYGYDPENQLCTDDFAGHLAHNCNLSVKAIVAIAAWGMILDMMGRENKFTAKAKEYAAKWKIDAFDKDHYKLTFDKENTWSIKYNLVWDKILELKIFDDDIFETEVAYYKKKINKYGLSLDNRSLYTKSDWQMWSTVLCRDKEYTDMISDALLRMLNETPDKAPFTDWYYTHNARCVSFRNRTVQGGLFINMLCNTNS